MLNIASPFLSNSFKYAVRSTLIRRMCNARAGSNELPAEPEPSVLVTKDGNITIIGLNRENVRNSIDADTANRLSRAIRDFEDDDASPIGVIYGIGGTFCAGYDVKELEQAEGQTDLPLQAKAFADLTRSHTRKPLIAGINGYCVGFGLELALLCDMRIMEDTAMLGFFNRALGVPTCNGGTARLPAMVGFSRALELLMTGRRVQADEALRIGLVNHVIATGACLGQVVHTAVCIAKYSFPSMIHDRNCAYKNTPTYNRSGFSQKMRNEVMSATPDVVAKMQQGAKLFAKTKHTKNQLQGGRSEYWLVHDKERPAWEKSEILIERSKNITRL